MNNEACYNGNKIAAVNCTETGDPAFYCVKSYGTLVSGSGHFVARMCSHHPQTNCTRQTSHGDLYTVCHYSCTTDGCNSAHQISAGLPQVMAVFLVCLSAAYVLVRDV
ncbi:omega-scoloptoxin(05)-Ssm1a-like [Physella acuta]|uniref:omega-scoloptoxin(05)-Ssm1a-like n=1 Tax=Physella acuta TaxID=109671 RepID=UPI0027DB5244|nr:omega-scoloptoxin(05)-Ssm1a-like [Physella acuta]